MKKVWSLEKRTTQQDIDSIKTLTETMIKDGDISTELAQNALDKVNNIKVGEWSPFFVINNYYKFCGEAKKKLSYADQRAIKALKEEIGKVPFSEDINTKFKNTHLDVFNTFRVVEGEIEDNSTDLYKYNIVKVNDGVYKYLWCSKR